MLHRAWVLLRDTVTGYIDDGAMSRGAAIAYYTIFSIAPLLVIATAIAGLAFGQEAVEGAIADQLRSLLGDRGAEAVQAMIRGASNIATGTLAGIIGVVTLLLTASGVFGELQTALNEIWKAPTPPSNDAVVGRLVRARIASLGLVAATGFLLLVSLLVSAALSAFFTWARGVLPGISLLLGLASFLLSFIMVTLLFAAIYKILPDRPLTWRNVAVGAVVTAFLFTLGKSLIGWYVGSSTIATSYGAAGALLVVLLWVYYSAQIFLLGAEFTKAWAGLQGSPEALAAGARAPEPAPPRRRRDRAAAGAAAKAPVPILPLAALGAVVMAALRRRRPRGLP
ncbi:YihY/virulence factor BrkB family protein [Roseicella aquatilis]|uniref:YihY/virulence factor BrkB family protein n=1 Tax=Roseicella aquatilis TaxID=2527868 RepID=A0A4R4D6N7_9PROT|nr:YihY/virulence factor BrkB family protein [Roseicella aquatilis]TCZ55987.1 YihY/virulence factor BrkB family protein [Roseicella aquatilis]